MNDYILLVLSSGVMVAIVEGIREAVKWRRTRKATIEDKAEEKREYRERQADLKIEERLEVIERRTSAQSEAIRYILYDRIRYLGQAYIRDGAIDFDDRRILNEMHKSYHNGLGGNGDLNVLMDEVNRLPLKRS